MSAAKASTTLGFGRADEAEAVMAFIREYWSERHVLARSRPLLEWQHADPAAGRTNFVVARDEAGEIAGILGFIPLSRYDAALAGAGRDTIWLTTWKVRSDRAHGLGLMLLRWLQKAYAGCWIGTVGLNPATRGIYDALGYATGELTRFCLINPRMTVFALALVPAGFGRTPATGDTVFQPLPRADFRAATEGKGLDSSPLVPLKTRAMVESRYLAHPVYDYRVLLATLGDRAGLIVTRLCAHAGATALRVVDFVGAPEVLAGAGPAFAGLLDQTGAEYLDFYACGLDDEVRAAGLTDAAEVEGLVLPSHFEPFERRNVPLLYSLHGPAGRRVICKGDADQDRPNLLEKEAGA